MTREVLIRADGKVTYISISPNLQKAVAATILAGIAWTTYSSVGLVVNERVIEQKTTEVAVARQAYSDLMNGVGSAYDEFARLVGNLQKSQSELLGLADSEMDAAQDPAQMAEVTRRAAAARQTLDQADAAIRAKLAIFQGDLTSIAAQHQKLNETIAQLQDDLRLADRERSQSEAENAALSAALQDSGQQMAKVVGDQEQREERIRLLQQAVATLTHDRNALVDRRAQLAEEIKKLEQRLIAYQTSQQSVVENLAQRTRTNVDEVLKTVAMTGLNVDKLLAKAGEIMPGIGGPFVDLTQVADLNAAESAMLTVSSLDDEVDRWDRLQFVLHSLPLAAPLDHFMLSSGFGTRRDPLNGKLAVHEGLDFSSELGASVMATAPGKVVFAGWKGDYGKMVEIDHGLGIHTRYGHLKSITVKVGDEVAYRQKIGTLGNTGRSTGPHVHYEVRVDDKAYDPMNFLEAGRYVFKG
ncbi:MAG TPA: peptidoglycan DD-metalloendopeptidase family protein [Hypericibacter adhaerens]|uniref:peptidoglycan DD-metalloendopeptidase family protein n=1 Tax=Hypericibacter adhaerens TaxID=2602016 RepID=UPI002C1D2168|nr:peptidoglycan DD-metalloendopeptidase family protein [Hypericibacter adhaerens]HWA44933.1 peptidoglycan DD-metalloendopeptidase family protein [Hypericibacter adhaerens]